MNEISETKERIFDTFIELSSIFGYENVTVRDVAKKVGINVASIYYHYDGKEKILESVYEYYENHYFDNRKPVEMMKQLIETAGADEMIAALARNYLTDDQKKYVRMILITKIVNMRLFQDTAANAMFNEHNADDMLYVTSILQHGADVGRIHPDFDIEAFAGVLIGSMVALGIEAFARPDYTVKQLDHEKRMLAMLSRLLATGLL